MTNEEMKDLKGFASTWNTQTNSGGLLGGLHPQNLFPQNAGPACGYCPHCGRGGFVTRPYIWCGTTTQTTQNS